MDAKIPFMRGVIVIVTTSKKHAGGIFTVTLKGQIVDSMIIVSKGIFA